VAINATNNGTKRELIPAGNYIARCYQMVEIGTVNESFQGEQKQLHKVRIGWELPTEMRVFDETKGPQPLVISNEYTLSLNEKATLRKMLASWRGKDFSEAEAKSFDITKLLGVPCMLNIIHKPSASDPTKIYERIGSVSPMPKGVNAPDQINPTFVLSYDEFDEGRFNTLPDFIKDKMKGSLEYAAITQPHHTSIGNDGLADDLPF
jgi:hypothetical protein